MKIFLSERKKKKRKKTQIFCVVREKRKEKKVTSWSSNAPLEILLLTRFQWHTTFGLAILYKVVFCVYKLDFRKKMLEKGGIFEGSSCVFGRKSIIVIVQSWFFRVQIKFNLFHGQLMVWDGHGLKLI